MKRILYIAVPISIFLSGCAAWVQTTYQPSPQPVYTNNPPTDYNNNSGYTDGYSTYDDSPQTDQVFYDELSPYGQWVDYPDYGYVWTPNAGPDFRPYATNGYWTYSDYGWTWVSNYNWGWAPFHYGRWFYDNYYGWMWMPGHEWAPAWVTWGSYGDYYCWAPIAPRVDVRYISSNGGWTPPENSWNVVQRRRINQVNVNTYIVRTNAAVIRNVVIINNINTNERVGGSKVNRRDPVYNRGPRVNDVENVTNSRIQPVRINDNRKPGAQVVNNNQLNVYRPEIKQNLPVGIARPAPRKVETKPNTPNNPQPNQPNRPDVNRDPAQNQNPRPTRPQQNPNKPDNNQPNNRPDNNPNQPQPNQNPRPNNQPQQQQPNNRPDNNQNPQPNQNPRPNNQPQQQQPNKPDNNQNQPQPNQNPRPNNQPQQQQPNRPDNNQDQPQPNQNPRPNNQPQQQQQPNRPDVNRDPAQRQDIKPNNQQTNPTPKPTNFFGLKKRPAQQPVKKTDTVRRAPNRQ